MWTTDAGIHFDNFAIAPSLKEAFRSTIILSLILNSHPINTLSTSSLTHPINQSYQHILYFYIFIIRFADSTYAVKDSMEVKQAEAEKREEEWNKKKKQRDAKLSAGGWKAQVHTLSRCHSFASLSNYPTFTCPLTRTHAVSSTTSLSPPHNHPPSPPPLLPSRCQG